MYRSDDAEATVLVVVFNGRVFGVDPGSGSRLWEQELDEPGLDTAVEVHLAPPLLLCCGAKHLHALEYPTGRRLWKTKLAGTYTTRQSMLVHAGRVLVGRGGELACYSLQGELLWHDGYQGKGVGRVALAVPGQVRQMDAI